MRHILNAGPVLAVVATLGAIAMHPALAVPAPPPPAVPEPSPALAIVIGTVVLAFALVVKQFVQRRRTARQQS
jgi:uncharacterized membrane protein